MCSTLTYLLGAPDYSTGCAICLWTIFRGCPEAMGWCRNEMLSYFYNSGIYLSNTTKKFFVTSAMASLQPLAFFGQKAADTHSFFGEDSLYSLKAVRKFLWIFKSFSLIIFVETILLQHWHSLHNLLSYLGPLELLGLHWGQNGNWFIHFWPSVEAVLNLPKSFSTKKVPKLM